MLCLRPVDLESRHVLRIKLNNEKYNDICFARWREHDVYFRRPNHNTPLSAYVGTVKLPAFQRIAFCSVECPVFWTVIEKKSLITNILLKRPPPRA